jgi:hypothetical protein
MCTLATFRVGLVGGLAVFLKYKLFLKKLKIHTFYMSF